MRKLIFSLSFVLFLTACQSNSGQQGENPEEPQVACTQDAKLCPDGSYVGRTGPNCEFAECPTTATPPEQGSNEEGWKTVTNEKGITFKYPEKLPDKYSNLLVDPEYIPIVQVTDETFKCEPPEYQDGPPFSTESKTIDGKVYCLKISGDAAAGSRYNTYSYSTEKDDKMVLVKFTLRQVNCGNYDEPQKSECETEQKAFNPDDLAVKILDTVSF